MNKSIILASVALKSGVFSKGTKKGQAYRIGVCTYGNASGRVVKRISQNPEISLAFARNEALKQSGEVAGELKLLKTNPYTFKDATGKDVVASSKWCVVFEGETDEQAIFAHGRQPLGYIAKATATLAPVAGADAQA